MQSSDTAPNLGYPKPKISLLDVRLPEPLPSPAEQDRLMAEQLGMTVEELGRYLDDLPKR
ncbi:MAG TPA: hypothetical protein DDZ88_19750 [Verrucomicrobiales bacterium]|nr:hypothetical protein [Verrucomicrobiales bacterium]